MSEEINIGSVQLLSLIAACQGINQARCCYEYSGYEDQYIDSYLNDTRNRIWNEILRRINKLSAEDVKHVSMVVGRLRQLPKNIKAAIQTIEAACIYDKDGVKVEIKFHVEEEGFTKKRKSKRGDNECIKW